MLWESDIYGWFLYTMLIPFFPFPPHSWIFVTIQTKIKFLVTFWIHKSFLCICHFDLSLFALCVSFRQRVIQQLACRSKRSSSPSSFMVIESTMLVIPRWERWSLICLTIIRKTSQLLQYVGVLWHPIWTFLSPTLIYSFLVCPLWKRTHL